MTAQPTAERRARPRQSASLPTMGLSLEELVLLLEISPKGWTEQEALGLVRRISREVCAKVDSTGMSASRLLARWKKLSTATDDEIREELSQTGRDLPGTSGDAMLARVAKLLKHDLPSLHPSVDRGTDPKA